MAARTPRWISQPRRRTNREQRRSRPPISLPPPPPSLSASVCPLISCFHPRSWPGSDGADSAEQMPGQRCSRGGDSGRAVIPLPSIPSSHSRAFFYGNTVAESSLGFVNQRNMLQTLHPATAFPCTFGRNSPLSSRMDAQILFLEGGGARGNAAAPEKTLEHPGAALQVKAWPSRSSSTKNSNQS